MKLGVSKMDFSYETYKKMKIQKYRVAAAMTILKTKPPDKTAIEYCRELRSSLLNAQDILKENRQTPVKSSESSEIAIISSPEYQAGENHCSDIMTRQTLGNNSDTNFMESTEKLELVKEMSKKFNQEPPLQNADLHINHLSDVKNDAIPINDSETELIERTEVVNVNADESHRELDSEIRSPSQNVKDTPEHFSGIKNDPILVDDSDTTFMERSEKIDLIKKNIAHIKDDTPKDAFGILQCVKKIKDIVTGIDGPHSYSGILPDGFRQNSEVRESGYQTGEPVVSHIIRHRMNDFAELDGYMMKIASFLCSVSEKNDGRIVKNEEVILEYVSDMFGRTFDVLERHDISLPCADKISEELLDIIESPATDTDYFSQSNALKKFTRLCKSRIFINFTREKLTDRLSRLLEDVREPNRTPYEESDVVDPAERSFHIFKLMEISIRPKETEIGDRIESEDTQSSSDRKFSIGDVWRSNWKRSEENAEKFVRIGQNGTGVTSDRLKEIFDELTIRCIESHPLLSYWAMELSNVLK